MRRVRTAALAAAALVIGTTGAALATGADLASAAVPCTVAYTVQNQWNTGFTTPVVVTNNGAARTSWTVRWSYAGDQRVTQGWNARISQSGQAVTALNESYNGNLPSGGSVQFGFKASYSGATILLALSTVSAGSAVEKRSPNIGRPLFDSSCVTSSWRVSQCSIRSPFATLTTSPATQARARPLLVKRPCSST